MQKDSDSQNTTDMVDSAQHDDERPVKVHMKTWIVIVCTNFVYFAQLTAIISSGFLAQPIAELVGGTSITLWFNQSLNLSTIAVSLPASQMADYWGRKTVLLVLLAFGFAGTMVVARAQSVPTLIAGFVLVGVNYGCQPILFAVPSEVLPRKQRAIAQATVNMSASIGGIVALVIGGALLRHNHLENYRTYFYIVAALFGVSFFGILFCYSPPPREEQVTMTLRQKLRALDWVGYILVAPGLTLFSIACSWSKNPYPWSNPHIVAPFVIGVVMILIFIFYEWRIKKDGILHHAVFAHKNLVIALLAVWIDGVSFFTANNYFARQFGMFTGSDMLISGVAFGMLFIIGGMATVGFGWVSTRFRIVRVPGIVALSLIVLFNVAMATTTASTPEVNYWGFTVFGGLGLGGVMPTFIVAAQLSTPPELIALVSGLLSVARPIGGVIALAINNAIFNNTLSKQIPNKIPAAVLPLGLPASSLGALIKALTAGDTAALAKVPGATPEILAAGQAALMDAFAVAFRNLWITAACLCLPGVIVTFFLKDPRSEFKAHIDAPLEVAVAEEQKRAEEAEAVHLEDTKISARKEMA